MKTQLQQLVEQEVQAIKELDEEVWKKKKEVIERFAKKRELLIRVCEHKICSTDRWYSGSYSMDTEDFILWTEETTCSNCGFLLSTLEGADCVSGDYSDNE